MKTILVIDMPNTCEECQFRSYNQCYALEYNRTLIEKWDGTDEFKTRNKICPLKPIPHKREAIGILNDYERGKILGFNSCLKIILGEKE